MGPAGIACNLDIYCSYIIHWMLVAVPLIFCSFYRVYVLGLYALYVNLFSTKPMTTLVSGLGLHRPSKPLTLDQTR